MSCCGKGKKKFRDAIIHKKAVNSNEASTVSTASTASTTPKVILPPSLQLKKAENRKRFLQQITKTNPNGFLTDTDKLTEMNPRQRRIQRRNERILVRNERIRMNKESS